MRTLVYIRRSRVFDDMVLDFAKKNLSAESVLTISEYFNGDFRIDMNTTKWDDCSATQNFIDEKLDLSKIIFRDRVLRNTSHSECLTLIRRATGEILNIFSKHSFESLVIYPVDNYILDILAQVASYNDTKTYGVCNFFMKGYKRITSYGEHNPFREPAESEVDQVDDILKNNFRSHMAPNRNSAFKAAIVRYVKYKIRYPLFYLIGAKLMRRKEYDLLATPYITTVRRLSNFFVERFFTSIDKIDFSKKTIFVPLHYFPEATLEYWSGDIRQVEFEHMLRCKVDELSLRYDQILLKEHPASVYNNSSIFYKSLLDNPKIIFIDPFVSTITILNYIDIVGAWTGTIGIEALVAGKKVEFFSKNQYYFQAMLKYNDNFICENNAFSIINVKLFIKEILSGTIINEKN